MKVTVESKKGLKTNLRVFIDKKIIADKIASRLDELSKTVNMKGFRPGKVPIDVLKRQFGKAVYGEVLENVLKETDLIYNFFINKFDNEYIIYEIIYNGSPNFFLKSMGEKDLNFDIQEKDWVLK